MQFQTVKGSITGMRAVAVSFSLLILIGLWSAVYMQIRHDHEATSASALLNAENLSQAVSEHVAGTFRALDQVMLNIIDEFGENPDKFDAGDTLRRHSNYSGMAFQLTVIGPDGMMGKTSTPNPSNSVYLGDRVHFKVHVNSKEDSLFISLPLIGRVSGRWSIQLTRRIMMPDGNFGGVLVLSLDPTYLSDFFRTLHIGRNGVVSMAGYDGVIRARATGSGNTEIGQSLSDTTFQTLIKSKSSGSYTASSVIDGIERIFYYRSIPEYKLVVILGLSVEQIYQEHEIRKMQLLIAAGVISFCIFLFALFLLFGISSQIRTEAALRQREKELLQSQTEAKAASEAKSNFLSVVSHELRTPLTSINGALGLLNSGRLGTLPDRAMQLLKIAENNSARLIRIVNDILDFQKVISGQMDYHFASINLLEVVERSIDSSQMYCLQYGVTCQLIKAPEIALVWADAERIVQVMNNIISNAAKFSKLGDKIEISVERSHLGYRMLIRDYGAGIPAAFKDRIFEQFVQVDGTSSRNSGGTGLGLSIAKSIVDAHRGTITFESKIGEGTTFVVDLPSALDEGA